MKSWHKLSLICAAALLFRLALLLFIQHPGIGDSNHYYNLGRFLADGQGLNIDYIWQYNNPPDDLIHPEDYWMPLTGLFPAASMSLLGQTVKAALLPFIIMGSLVPVLAYVATRQFQCSETTALLMAAAAAFLPEFVLNSLRTDTTMPNLLLVCAGIILLTHGLKTGARWAFAASGLAVGLAYLVRSDSSLLIPMLIVTLIVYIIWGRKQVANPARWRYTILIPVIAILLALPWSLRNLQLSGTFSTPKLEYMFYLTDFRQHFVYDTELNLQTLLASQTPAQLIGKRLFEMAASLKLMYTTLDIFLPVAVWGGLLLLFRSRDRDRWLTLAPTLILLGGVFVFYTVFVPLKSQGGSFKKAFLTLIPLLLPLAAYALERVIQERRWQISTMLIVVFFLGANAFELVRADANALGRYLDYIEATVQKAKTLPDTNGDGEIILMAQDPFMLRFYEMRSVMLPMENRDTILEVAQRYGVDYVMMPPDRPALDPLYLGTEVDKRFIRVADVPGINVKLFGFDFDASP